MKAWLHANDMNVWLFLAACYFGGGLLGTVLPCGRNEYGLGAIGWSVTGVTAIAAWVCELAKLQLPELVYGAATVVLLASLPCILVMQYRASRMARNLDHTSC